MPTNIEKLSDAEPTRVAVKRKGVNPYDIRDGEMLPCIGGPINGELRKVFLLFQFPGGDMPSSMMRVGGEHWYCLNAQKRQWIYQEPKP